MKAYPVSFTFEAIRDLDAIYDYIANDSPHAAEQIINRLELFCTETLSNHPFAGKQAIDLKQGIRTFTVSSYRVLYSVPNKSVMIKRIIHGSRDVSRLKI